VSKLCVTTVCSDDSMSYFIPLFIYTWTRAYPEYDVKVYVRGKLRDNVRGILDGMRERKLGGDSWEVVEDVFTGYPNEVSVCNSCRHLLSAARFKKYKYVYVTDIDFLAFRHHPSHMAYYARVMRRSGVPYAGFRGPYRKPHRPSISANGWKGWYTRVAGGTFMLKSPEWFQKTMNMRKHYKRLGKRHKKDGKDRHYFASYREYDEVMLYRIIRGSGMKTPKKKNCFPSGQVYNRNYRDIHLGDFTKSRGKKTGKMSTLITNENIKAYWALQREEAWQWVLGECTKNKRIKNAISHMHSHIHYRKEKIQRVRSKRVSRANKG